MSIVNDVLDFSKIEAEKVTLEDRPFVLESCVDLSLEMQSIKANAKRLVLNYIVDDSVPWRLRRGRDAPAAGGDQPHLKRRQIHR